MFLKHEYIFTEYLEQNRKNRIFRIGFSTTHYLKTINSDYLFVLHSLSLGIFIQQLIYTEYCVRYWKHTNTPVKIRPDSASKSLVSLTSLRVPVSTVQHLIVPSVQYLLLSLNLLVDVSFLFGRSATCKQCDIVLPMFSSYYRKL